MEGRFGSRRGQGGTHPLTWIRSSPSEFTSPGPPNLSFLLFRLGSDQTSQFSMDPILDPPFEVFSIFQIDETKNDPPPRGKIYYHLKFSTETRYATDSSSGFRLRICEA